MVYQYIAAMHPAEPDTGIVFRRVDVKPFEIIEAHIDNVSNTERCTELKNKNGYTVSMVEHTLSALRGMGIDNVLVDVHGEELPIFDGSSFFIATKIAKVGVLDQNVQKRHLRLNRTIRVEHNNSFLEAHPSPMLHYSVCFKNDHNVPSISDQTSHFSFMNNHYLTYIAPARTFCYEKEIVYLKNKGLIQGGSLDNGIVIGEHEIYPNLRFPDEFSRHKLLDLIGDLALIPSFSAKIEGEGISHYLNTLFAKEISKNLS